MKIKGRLALLTSIEGATIEVHDSDASITFLRIKLTPEQLSAALSKTLIACELDVVGFDRVGKKMEIDRKEFEIPKELSRGSGKSVDSEKLREIAQETLTDGWIADGYFGSQSSFFQQDGKYYARVTIRRWINTIENEKP